MSFCDKCPRKLRNAPTEPCPQGMEHATQPIDNDRRRGAATTTEERGCPWGINSAAHGYCFWKYAETLQGSPATDKEICDLLGISQGVYERILASALAKAKANKDNPDWQGFREAVLEKAATSVTDNTMYIPSNFQNDLPLFPETKLEDEEELPEDMIGKEKKRKYRGQPIHRSGKRTDLYGITSQKTRERLHKEKTSKP